VVLCLDAAVAMPAGTPAAGEQTGRLFRVLQLNLCNSGIAGCYTGRAMAQAAAVIRAVAPDVVTLNEVCEDDVPALDRTLADVRHGGTIRAFAAAPDRSAAGPSRCRNGLPYGVGLLAHVPAPDRGHTTDSGVYPVQDGTDPEERVWLCVHATGAFYACTTHLASTSPADALAQCGYLLGTAIPAARERGGPGPAVLGGDLNLGAGGAPDVRSCVPPGYLRTDDGGVQQIVATADFTLTSSRSIGMNGSTDHPGLLATFTLAPPA
jgi:hypothetical protein